MRFTKFIVLLVVSLLIFNTNCFAFLSNASPEVVIGDIDNDNYFNSNDYSLLRRYLLEMVDESMLSEKGDVDGNGKFDSDDYSWMKRHLLGLIDKFPRELSSQSTSTPVPATPTTKITPTTVPTLEKGGSIRLDLDKTTSFVGDIVTATISIRDVKNFAGFQTVIKYDPLVLCPIDSDGNNYTQDTIPEYGVLLNKIKYLPTSMASNDLSNGILNFGRSYMSLQKYKNDKIYETTGSLAKISFKVISAKTTSVLFTEFEAFPKPNTGVMLFDYDGNMITNFSVIQAKPIVMNSRGDIDNNGIVDKHDVDSINKLLQKLLPELKNISSADVNGDGEFTIDDLVLLQNMVTGVSPSAEPTPIEPTPTPTINQTSTPTCTIPLIKGEVKLTVDKPSANVGEIVQASIDYSNIYGFAGFQANLVYDPSYLQPVYLVGEEYLPYENTTQPEYCCLLNEKHSPVSMASNNILEGNLTFGRAYQFMASYIKSGLSESTGVLAKIKFRVLKSGNTLLELKDCPSMPNANNGTLIFNWDSDQIRDYSLSNSSCNLQLTQIEPETSPTPTSCSQEFILSTDKSYVKPGDIVTSKISISNIKNFAAYQVALKYDPKLLRPFIYEGGKKIIFDSETIPVATGLKNQKYNPIDIAHNDLTNGILIFGRAYMSLASYKALGVPETSQDLCVISFEAISEGSVNLHFQKTPEIHNPDGVLAFDWDGAEINDIIVKYNSNFTQIPTDATPSVTPTPTPTNNIQGSLSINIPDSKYKVGDIIKASIDVNVESLAGYQVNLKYDPTVLEPQYFDGSTYVPYKENTVPNSGTLFMQSKYGTNPNADNDLVNGYLNFCNGYIDLPLYQKASTYDKAGSIAVIYFKVLKESPAEIYFEDCETMPGAYKGTLLFDKDANRINDYSISIPSVNSSKTPKLSLLVDKTDAKVGEYISATLAIQDVNNFQGYQASLKYDPSVLEPVLFNGESFEPYLSNSTPERGNLLRQNFSPIEMAHNNLEKGILTFGNIYIDRPKLSSSGIQESSGSLAVIYFKVLKKDPTEIRIINYDDNSLCDATMLFDYTKEKFGYFEVSPSKVTINKASSPIKKGVLYLTTNTKNAVKGDIIKYTLGVENIKNLTGYQVSLKYDPTVLTPISEDGCSYDVSTTPKHGSLLSNRKLSTFDVANNDLYNGFLTFGRCYMDLTRFRSVGIQQTSGTIAELYFKLLENTRPVVDFTNANTSENCTYLFDSNGNLIKDYDIRK